MCHTRSEVAWPENAHDCGYWEDPQTTTTTTAVGTPGAGRPAAGAPTDDVEHDDHDTADPRPTQTPPLSPVQPPEEIRADVVWIDQRVGR